MVTTATHTLSSTPCWTFWCLKVWKKKKQLKILVVFNFYNIISCIKYSGTFKLILLRSIRIVARHCSSFCFVFVFELRENLYTSERQDFHFASKCENVSQNLSNGGFWHPYTPLSPQPNRADMIPITRAVPRQRPQWEAPAFSIQAVTSLGYFNKSAINIPTNVFLWCYFPGR